MISSGYRLVSDIDIKVGSYKNHEIKKYKKSSDKEIFIKLKGGRVKRKLAIERE